MSDRWQEINDLSFIEFLGVFVILIGLEIPVMMLFGLVISDLWMWFITPMTAIAIGKAHACGIWVLISLLTQHRYK